MDYLELDKLKKQKQLLNGKLSWIDSVINEYISGRYDEMGLISDEVITPAFKALKLERATIFNDLRQFNAKYAKKLHQAQS